MKYRVSDFVLGGLLGTKTAAVAYLVGDGDDTLAGSVVGRGVAGPSNKNSVGEQAAISSFLHAVASALQEAGRDAKEVSCFVLSMAGVDTEADAVFWQHVCTEHYPAARAVVENDSVAALCSGTNGVLCGIVVISGTGSIGMGAASATSPKLRVGGMGPMLGDGGNGYSIGLAALGAAVKASDARGPSTPLLQMILEKFNLDNVDGLLGLAYGPTAKLSSWDEVAFRLHPPFTCFAGTKVQILTQTPSKGRFDCIPCFQGACARQVPGRTKGTQFTCFTGTKYKY